MFKDATPLEIDTAVQQSIRAFEVYKKMPLSDRKRFMYAVAEKLEKSGDLLIHTAMEETHLPEARLKGERSRTVLQLRQYADAAADGSWMDVRIDRANSQTGSPDIRKTKIPLGPVVVFGSSNFPFAYSTAGGDTGCAFAAGCTVIVKAHPAHARTSQMVADIIQQAAKEQSMPEGIFSHLHGVGFETGKYLVTHPGVKAVGFTGSLSGGRQLYDWGCQRKEPIPVFSEMGSTNPVFLLPEKLTREPEEMAIQYAQSITQGSGQFCTKPGLLFAIRGEGLERFKTTLKKEIVKMAAQQMLHPGIAKAYDEHRNDALQQKGVATIAKSEVENKIQEGIPLIATVQGDDFIKNAVLRREVFGPFSLIIECADKEELCSSARDLEGQLTATLMGTEKDILENEALKDIAESKCGRLILNGVPTGVTVCRAMNHGGPYPATTDSRFTSVGADGILRFVRPVSYQNWPDNLLPDELKDGNPLKIRRLVDGVWES